jgi:hypothetical protein
MTSPAGSIGYPAVLVVYGTRRLMALHAAKLAIDRMKSAETTPNAALGKNHRVK